MPLNTTPQPFLPTTRRSQLREHAWLLPGALALVFVVLVAAWAENNDALEHAAFDRTIKTDAQSVDAQLRGRKDAEAALLRDVAKHLAKLPLDPQATLTKQPEVQEGIKRLWRLLRWLDEDGNRLAIILRSGEVKSNVTEDLYFPKLRGQIAFMQAAIKDEKGNPTGNLIADYETTDLLRSSDLNWLTARYLVEFISADLSETIATTENSQRTPQGPRREFPLSTFSEGAGGDTTRLRLTAYEPLSNWYHNPRTFSLIIGLLLGGLTASLWLRREMQQVRRAVKVAQTEAAWRQSMEDSALVGLRARDPEGRLLYVNKTLCEMVGYNREDLVGLKPPLPFWPADSIDDMMARNMSTLAGEAPTSGFETRWQHRDGHVLDVMIFEARLVNSTGQHIGWMGSIVDISERKRLEEKDRRQVEALAQHARLNDMGLLSAELAHELNQPLTTIVSYSAGLGIALRKQASADPDLLFAVDEVHKYSKKAGDIVHWIRRQTTRSEPERKAWDINVIVSDVVALRRRQLTKDHVQLLLELDPDACICQVDRIAIEQVISNLLRNAADALMEKGGNRILSVQTKRHTDANGANAFVQLTVNDNGPGLQGRTLDMLCATFYSTKSAGMGLGLGICRAIVESHTGTMYVSEATGGGATFGVTLSLVDSSPTTM